MVKHCFVSIILILILCVCAGCNNHSTQSATNTKLPAGVVLPAWAPANPSPQFIRAATTLKPIPDDAQGPNPDQALHAKLDQVRIPAWEFFGTLSDQEVSNLKANKELKLPFGTMNSEQQAAFNHFLDVWQNIMKDWPSNVGLKRDLRIALAGKGAKQDLSNVLCKLVVRDSGIVAMMLYVIQPDSSLSQPEPFGIGSL
jgi:hypothetical protein